MSGGALRRIGWLRKIRAGSAGIARLLLLAFTLQLAVPLLELGGVAALAGVDEAHVTVREADERVVLDDLGVAAGRGDAVAEEGDGVAVPQGEVGVKGAGGEAQSREQVSQVHGRRGAGLGVKTG